MRWRWGKVLGIWVVSVCTPALVFAADQPQPPPAGTPDQAFMQRRVQAFADKLGLDQAAHAKVQEIAERYSLRRRQVRDELTQRMLKLREEETWEIKAVLTPEQQAHYDQMLSLQQAKTAPSEKRE